MNVRKYVLEDRLIEFEIKVSELAESLPSIILGYNIKDQLI